MKFLIITHVNHIKKDQQFFGYAPYVREMNLWFKYVDQVDIIAPMIKGDVTEINLPYKHNNLNFISIPEFSFTSISNTFLSFFKVPLIVIALFRACKNTDHIHLRCPGNIGLLGSVVQICFPKKTKTAKYAGNWDPEAKQPLSYRFQKWLLSHTFLTRNMTVLVYGDWNNQTKNIKPFFTATYEKNEIVNPNIRNYDAHLKFIFIGSLVEGKRPLFCLEIIKKLKEFGVALSIDVYGDGVLLSQLKHFVKNNGLDEIVIFHGNKDKMVIKKALQEAHFLLLPSKSEGWPKAVAEAMFFGTIPIATKVSCLPNMLDNGNRGILIEPILDNAVSVIINYISEKDLISISHKASKWSHGYTLDVFENEISKLL
ncbi:glycosyltransferase [Flavivirga algicola]|uniref:Glycosyltransferase n=1 Tax=Flavivirga algicola TaxID=2729136 RepID=A0ABX1RS13_9FLAO|nr:glycosyltransferase [Flavivirga algicola]NMH86340.1 glycosyltransferase [Flavivirga algicola]